MLRASLGSVPAAPRAAVKPGGRAAVTRAAIRGASRSTAAWRGRSSAPGGSPRRLLHLARRDMRLGLQRGVGPKLDAAPRLAGLRGAGAEELRAPTPAT